MSEIGYFQRTKFAAVPGVGMSGVGHRLTHNDIHHGRHYAISPTGNDLLIEGTIFVK